jgi:hypothetical protein
MGIIVVTASSRYWPILKYYSTNIRGLYNNKVCDLEHFKLSSVKSVFPTTTIPNKGCHKHFRPCRDSRISNGTLLSEWELWASRASPRVAVIGIKSQYPNLYSIGCDVIWVICLLVIKDNIVFLLLYPFPYFLY